MANDFSGDSNCKALYNMESGALTTDSKGTNTLTDNNTVQTETVDFQQGSACADLELGNGEHFSITDANLDSGFPLKSGETNDDFSVCAWVKFESVSAFGTIAAKYDRSSANDKTFMLRLNPTLAELQAYIGYSSGASFEELTNNDFQNMATATWYHICLGFENTTKTWELRVWESVGGATSATGTATNNLSITDVAFTIGASLSNGSSERYLDGLIDEVVVFDKKLTATEIDEIRAGTYGAAAETSIPVFMHHYTKNLRT